MIKLRGSHVELYNLICEFINLRPLRLFNHLLDRLNAFLVLGKHVLQLKYYQSACCKHYYAQMCAFLIIISKLEWKFLVSPIWNDIFNIIRYCLGEVFIIYYINQVITFKSISKVLIVSWKFKRPNPIFSFLDFEGTYFNNSKRRES